MIRKLAELKDQCIKLDLTVHRTTVRESKMDYVTALKEHYMKQDFPQGMPFTELPPMLSYPYWSLKAAERERLWHDQNDWLIQEKIDGVRMILHFVRGVGTFAHGRNPDSSTYRRRDLSMHLLFSDLIPDFSGVIDCECVMDHQINTEPFTPDGSVIKAHTLQAVPKAAAPEVQEAALEPDSERLKQALAEIELLKKIQVKRDEPQGPVVATPTTDSGLVPGSVQYSKGRGESL